jgi:hypothetical protein
VSFWNGFEKQAVSAAGVLKTLARKAGKTPGAGSAKDNYRGMVANYRNMTRATGQKPRPLKSIKSSEPGMREAFHMEVDHARGALKRLNRRRKTS